MDFIKHDIYKYGVLNLSEGSRYGDYIYFDPYNDASDHPLAIKDNRFNPHEGLHLVKLDYGFNAYVGGNSATGEICHVGDVKQFALDNPDTFIFHAENPIKPIPTSQLLREKLNLEGVANVLWVKDEALLGETSYEVNYNKLKSMDNNFKAIMDYEGYNPEITTEGDKIRLYFEKNGRALHYKLFECKDPFSVKEESSGKEFRSPRNLFYGIDMYVRTQKSENRGNLPKLVVHDEEISEGLISKTISRYGYIPFKLEEKLD